MNLNGVQGEAILLFDDLLKIAAQIHVDVRGVADPVSGYTGALVIGLIGVGADTSYLVGNIRYCRLTRGGIDAIPEYKVPVKPIADMICLYP